MKLATSVIAAALTPAAFGITNPDVDLLYSDLRAAYSGGFNGVFTTFAEDTTTHQSYGVVSRLVTPLGTATFNAGFVSAANPADFIVTISVSSVTATTAQGVGTFVSTDVNGSTIAGNFSGVFTLIGGVTDFTGTVSNTVYSGLTTFDGDSGSFTHFTSPTLGGTINITTPVTGMFTGTPQSLLIEPLTTVNLLVPSPGTIGAGLAAFGMLGCRSRRRAEA